MKSPPWRYRISGPDDMVGPPGKRGQGYAKNITEDDQQPQTLPWQPLQQQTWGCRSEKIVCELTWQIKEVHSGIGPN